MDKKRKKELKKANSQKVFPEIGTNKIEKAAKKLFSDLNIKDTDSRETIIARLEK